jgi:hypothetical protein
LKTYTYLTSKLDQIDAMICKANKEPRDMYNLFLTLVNEYQMLITHQQKHYDETIKNDQYFDNLEY